jgi:signal transduction histidine kinase
MLQTTNCSEHDGTIHHSLLKTMAHDLRSPIAIIISAASLLAEPGEQDNIQLLEIIRSASLNAIELINDVMKDDNDFDGLYKEPADMETLLKNCASLMELKAAKKGQHILLDCESVTVAINRIRIWRVINNLLDNAIKFSPEGSVISVGMKKVDGKLQIFIKDHGIGIPANAKNKPVEKLSEVRRAGTTGELSNGMGLYICRKIINAHGGRLWYVSTEGSGATFYIELPLEEVIAA